MDFITIFDLEAQLKISKSTIYRWMRDREFPQPIKLGRRAVRWRQDDIEKWIKTIDQYSD